MILQVDGESYIVKDYTITKRVEFERRLDGGEGRQFVTMDLTIAVFLGGKKFNFGALHDTLELYVEGHRFPVHTYEWDGSTVEFRGTSRS